MGVYYLGSVGTAEALRLGEDGNPEVMFVSKTLLETGLTISSTKDSIRGGEGASIQFEFTHNPSVDIKLVDAIFKTDYIEAQLGLDFSEAGDESNESYQTETVVFEDGMALLSKEVVPLPISCDGKREFVAWGNKKGSDEWYMLDVNTANRRRISLPGAKGKYCVSYLAKDMNARVAEVTTNLVPELFYLIITVPLFDAKGDKISHSKPVGQVQFEVPRFQLNGAMNFSLSASSYMPVTMEGQAIIAPNYGSDGEDVLLRVIEIDYSRTWSSDVVEIYIDPDTAEVGQTPIFYAVLKSGETIKLSNVNIAYRLSPTDNYSYLTETFVFKSDGTYYFNLNNGVQFRTDGDDFYVKNQNNERSPLWTYSDEGGLPTDYVVEISKAQDLRHLYYNEDVYFM